jgi:hypothetical protein
MGLCQNHAPVLAEDGNGHDESNDKSKIELGDTKLKAKNMLLEVLIPTLSLGIKDLVGPIFSELVGPMSSSLLEIIDEIHDGIMKIVSERGSDTMDLISLHVKNVETKLREMETLRKLFKAIFGSIEGVAECVGPSLELYSLIDEIFADILHRILEALHHIPELCSTLLDQLDELSSSMKYFLNQTLQDGYDALQISFSKILSRVLDIIFVANLLQKARKKTEPIFDAINILASSSNYTFSDPIQLIQDELEDWKKQTLIILLNDFLQLLTDSLNPHLLKKGFSSLKSKDDLCHDQKGNRGEELIPCGEEEKGSGQGSQE